MKKVVIRYGLLASLLIVVLSAIDMFLIAKVAGAEIQEIAGYLTMLISMVFVFLGIRHYRDMVNGGFLSFGEGMKVGVLIVLIPSLFFGIFDILYTEVINPGWMEQYYLDYESKLKATIPADKLESALKDLQAQKEIFSNPFLQFLLMALTVFIIGLIVTIISSLTLKKVKK